MYFYQFKFADQLVKKTVCFFSLITTIEQTKFRKYRCYWVNGCYGVIKYILAKNSILLLYLSTIVFNKVHLTFYSKF